MGETFLSAFAVGVVTFALLMVAFLIARFFGKSQLRAFQQHFRQNFPDLQEGTRIFSAKQKSKGMRLDIALAADELKKELILVLDKKGEGLTHKVYPFKDLKEVNSSNEVISRGVLPKTYSYEQTMTLVFKDGSAYDFISENVSNKNGSDKGAELVKQLYAPWEEKFRAILG